MAQKIFQPIDFRAVLRVTGIILHAPAFMAFISVIIALLAREHYAIGPFLLTGALSLLLGQILIRKFPLKTELHLWDAMIVAALSWLLCPLIAAIPFYYIAVGYIHHGGSSSSVSDLTNIINVLFETFSAFTSTGLTMVPAPSEFPHSIQWWRSFCQWVGGAGLILLVLTLTQPNREQYKLYYSEARTENIGKNIRQTAQIIWLIYILFTLAGVLAFSIAGMPLWQALNHAMTAISTGGFSITNDSFMSYSSAIKWIGTILMLLGGMSFAIHYQGLFERKWQKYLFDTQQKLFFLIVFCGIGIVSVIQYINQGSVSIVDTSFNWVSALVTCGFNATDLSLYIPPIKLLVMFAMLVGACAGSTSGGFKIIRFRHLLSGVLLRIASITNQKEQYLEHVHEQKEIGELGTGLPRTVSAEKLYAAGILFTMFMVTIFSGWMVMLFEVDPNQAFDALFEVISAVSNSGLDVGIMGPAFPSSGKIAFTVMMWLGRIEIIPAFVLLSSFFIQRKNYA